MIEQPEHDPSDWRAPEERARDIAQAAALRERAREHGLQFEVFLPPALAEWVLDFVEKGVFIDPSEAVFVMLGEQQDLEPHGDLREEILKRSLESAMNDPHPGYSAEEVVEMMRERRTRPRQEPAVWRKDTYA